MKKRTFTILVIVVTAAVLIGLNELNLLEHWPPLSLVFLLGFYFLGQFAQRRFKS